MKIGDTITLAAADVEEAVRTFDKDRNRAIGLLADSTVRPLMAGLGWESNPAKFGPYDLKRGDEHLDIKVSWGKTVTFSLGEEDFAERNKWSALIFVVIDDTPGKDVVIECKGVLAYKDFPQVHISKYADGALYFWLSAVKRFRPVS